VALANGEARRREEIAEAAWGRMKTVRNDKERKKEKEKNLRGRRRGGG
jgi:hypothetical protein